MPEDIPDDAKIERALKDADLALLELTAEIRQWTSPRFRIKDIRAQITEALIILRKRAQS